MGGEGWGMGKGREGNGLVRKEIGRKGSGQVGKEKGREGMR